MKVINDNDVYEHELKVLTAVDPSYFYSGIGYNDTQILRGAKLYALYLPSTHSVLSERQDVLKRVKKGNDHSLTEPKLTKGGVLMQIGTPVPRDDLDRATQIRVINDFMLALRQMLRAAYVHTD